MGREKALAFVCICVAVIVVLKNAHVLHTRGYLTGGIETVGAGRMESGRLESGTLLPQASVRINSN